MTGVRAGCLLYLMLPEGGGTEDIMKEKRFYNSTRHLCLAAMFMALTIVLSMSVLSIPVPGGHLYMNDIPICTAALIFDPITAMVVGGVGAFLGDLIFYPTPMFVSLVTHGLQAAVISLLAHRRKGQLSDAILGVTAGAVIMVVGYSLGRAFVYATPEAAILKLPFQILQAVVGAAVSVVLCYGFKLRAAAEKMLHK